MKLRRSFLITLSVFGFCSPTTVPAQGPDDKGAVLRSPFNGAAPARPNPAPNVAASVPTTPTPPKYLKSLFTDAKSADPAGSYARHLVNPDDGPDINADLKIAPAAGPWLIMVISYPGNEGAARARKMCLEIKSKNRVPAYVFVKGQEERRKEYERVKKIFDEQQAFFREKNLWPEQPPSLRTQHIDVHHAVLIGGYADDGAAQKALATVKKWERPDENKVDLETKYFRVVDPKDPTKTVRAEIAHVNPFERAFVCRNPTVKQEAVQEAKLDVASLKRLNAGETLSLFNCKKPLTLAVKEFQTPHTVYDRGTPASVWEKIGIGGAERKDFARIDAHNLGETLRQLKLEAYVLHSKYSSTVTVGGFDGPNDPALKLTQDTLATRFNQATFAQIQFFPRPMPMPVPR